MGIEIERERRFLVNPNNIPDNVRFIPPLCILQAYITSSHGVASRVRYTYETNGDRNWTELTFKGNLTNGSNQEVTIPISGEQYQALLTLAKNRVANKYRTVIQPEQPGVEYHLDRFRGHLKPLVIVEAEFEEFVTDFSPPDWFDEEITDKIEYSNSHMSEHGLPKHFEHWRLHNCT